MLYNKESILKLEFTHRMKSFSRKNWEIVGYVNPYELFPMSRYGTDTILILKHKKKDLYCKALGMTSQRKLWDLKKLNKGV